MTSSKLQLVASACAGMLCCATQLLHKLASELLPAYTATQTHKMKVSQTTVCY